MKFLPLVWKNLFRRKVRTFFTVLSIVVAFVLYSYLAAIQLAFGMGVDLAGTDRLLVIHKVSFIQTLPESYKGRIEAVDGVADVSSTTWFGGIYQEPRNFFPQFAVEAESYLRLYPEIVLSDAAREAWLRNRTGVIVGRVTADRFGWEVGDRIPLQGTIWRTRSGPTWEFTIDGIFETDDPGSNPSMFLHHEYLAEANSAGARAVSQYIIRIADPALANEVAAAVDARFANSPAETKTSTEQALAQSLANQMGNIGAIMTAILTAVFFTVLIVTANTMAQSIRERTSEIAVLKTLGFTDRRVLAIVLVESVALAVAGGAIGLGLGSLLTGFGDPSGFLAVFFVPPRDLVIGGALVILLGFASGVVPGLQATRLRIVDALRKV